MSNKPGSFFFTSKKCVAPENRMAWDQQPAIFWDDPPGADITVCCTLANEHLPLELRNLYLR